jgi:hypothetical protein
MNKRLVFVLLALLAGCDKFPNKAEMHLSREEIKALCKSVGDKAYALANDNKKTVPELQWIEQGTAAECELKYLTGK